MNKKKTNWKPLARHETKNIIKEYCSGKIRNQIMLKYQIREGQFYRIIKDSIKQLPLQEIHLNATKAA